MQSKVFPTTKVRLQLAFTNLAGAAADPTEVTVSIKSPTDVVTSYTFSGGLVVRDSVGNYHFDFSFDKSGYWWFRVQGTGDLITATEGELTLERGEFGL